MYPRSRGAVARGPGPARGGSLGLRTAAAPRLKDGPPADPNPPRSMRRLALLLTIPLLASGGYALYRAAREPTVVTLPPDPRPRVVWVFEAKLPGGVVAAPTVTDGAVYASTVHRRGLRGFGVVRAIDPATGDERWAFDHDGMMLPSASAPVAHAGRLYFGEGMHGDFVCQFYCLDAATGALAWRHETAGHIESTPTIADGTVYLTAGDDGVHALDAGTGTPKWAHPFRTDLHFDTTPCVAGGRVYVGSGPSRLNPALQVACLDAATGEPVWRVPTDLPAWGAPTLHDGRLYVGLGNGRLTEGAKPPETPAGALLCLDPADGRTVWRFAAGDAVFQKPTAAGDRVYFGSRDGNVYAVRAADRPEVVYRVRMGGPVIAPPTVDGDKLYVVSVPGLVKCLAAADGRELWSLDLAERTRAQVSAFGAVRAACGRVYVGAEVTTGAGPLACVYCLEP